MNDHIAVRIKYFKKHATHFFHAKILALCAIVCQCVSRESICTTIIHKKHSYLPAYASSRSLASSISTRNMPRLRCNVRRLSAVVTRISIPTQVSPTSLGNHGVYGILLLLCRREDGIAVGHDALYSTLPYARSR